MDSQGSDNESVSEVRQWEAEILGTEFSVVPIRVDLGNLAEQTRDYVRQAKAANTIKAYQSDWQNFGAWCAAHGLTAMPSAPSVVAFYVTNLIETGRKTSTLQRRISAISQAHQAAGQENPTRSA